MYRDEFCNEQLKKNIRYLIKKKGMTNKDLQEKIDRAGSYLSKLLKEGNKQQPSFQVISDISRELEVTLDDLTYIDLEKRDRQIEENKLEDRQRMFLEILSKDTKVRKLVWKKVDLRVNNKQATIADLYQRQIGTGQYVFTSKFQSKREDQVVFLKSACQADLGDGVKVMLVQVGDVIMRPCAYELYLIKDVKSMRCCTNKTRDDEVFCRLHALWKSATEDPEYTMRDELIDNFLDSRNNENN